MKDITGEVIISEYEIPTLKSEPIKVGFKVAVNVYSKALDTMQDYNRMVMVIDGELERPSLMSYHLGNEQYLVRTRVTKKPKNVKVYRY